MLLIGTYSTYDPGTSVGGNFSVGGNLTVAGDISTSSATGVLNMAGGIYIAAVGSWPGSAFDGYGMVLKTDGSGAAPFNNAGAVLYRSRLSGTAGRSSHKFYTGASATLRFDIDETGVVSVSNLLSGVIQLPNNSASAPGLYFAGATQTGLYRDLGSLGFAAAGVAAGSVTSSGFQAGVNNGLFARGGSYVLFVSGDSGTGAGGELRAYGSQHPTKTNALEVWSGGTLYGSFKSAGATFLRQFTCAENVSIGGSLFLDGGVRTNGLAGAVRSVTNNTTVNTTDFFVLASANAGSVALTPSAALTGSTGALIRFKKTDGNTGMVSWGALVDGSTLFMTLQYEAATVITDGSAWYSL